MSFFFFRAQRKERHDTFFVNILQLWKKKNSARERESPLKTYIFKWSTRKEIQDFIFFVLIPINSNLFLFIIRVRMNVIFIVSHFMTSFSHFYIRKKAALVFRLRYDQQIFHGIQWCDFNILQRTQKFNSRIVHRAEVKWCINKKVTWDNMQIHSYNKYHMSKIFNSNKP